MDRDLILIFNRDGCGFIYYIAAGLALDTLYKTSYCIYFVFYRLQGGLVGLVDYPDDDEEEEEDDEEGESKEEPLPSPPSSKKSKLSS